MRSKYFSVADLVSPLILKTYKNPDDAWGLLHIKLIQTLDTLKEVTGMNMIINTSHLPADLIKQYGLFSERGLRSLTGGVGSVTGAHYKGLACDIDFYLNGARVTPQTMIDIIIKKREKFPHIVGLELGVNWNHVDCMGKIESPVKRNIPAGKIMCFYSDGRSPKII